ncbi:unnamed protein product, partial [Allacma fusca]
LLPLSPKYETEQN